MSAQIVLEAAEVINPTPGNEFHVRYTLHNMGNCPARIVNGLVYAQAQYSNTIHAGQASFIHGWTDFLEDTLAADERRDFEYSSSKLPWFTKSKDGIRPYFCGHLTYEDDSGISRKTHFAKGLWPGDAFFDQAFSN